MSRELIEVPLDTLILLPQVRTVSGMDDETLSGLADSIKESGVQQPVLVRREADGLVVLDGERRIRASKLAGLKSVPAIVDDTKLTAAEVTERQLLLDAQRVGLSVTERAEAIERLVTDTGWSVEQTAKKLGISAASVTRTLAVLKLPDEILQHVEAGRISADAAYQLSRVSDPGEQARLAEQVTEGLLTRDALTRKLKRVRRSQEARRGTRVTAAIGSGQTITFVGGDLTLDTVTDWLEQLLAKARKAKAQGLTLTTFAAALRDQAKAAGKTEGNP